MSKSNERFESGQRVIVTQQIPQRARVWTTRVEGEVIKFEQGKTGAWFAHSKDDRLWLDRLTVRRDDGELVVCNLDAYSHVSAMPAAAAPESSPPSIAEDVSQEEKDESDQSENPSEAAAGKDESNAKAAEPQANEASQARV